MATSPKFVIDDIVYSDASAKVGFLESYRVSSIHTTSAGTWVYQIKLQPKKPDAVTIGDAVDTTGIIKDLYFSENELLTFCEAVAVQITVLERRLNAAKAVRDSKCGG